MMTWVKASAIVKGIAGAVVIFVVIYVLSSRVSEWEKFPPVPKNVLIKEIDALDTPASSKQLGDTKFVDRGSFYYVTKAYSSEYEIGVISKYYEDEFKNKGWMYVNRREMADHSSEFCKQGDLGTLSFVSASGKSIEYKISITTGGSITLDCH
jgi:hypothetical protein